MKRKPRKQKPARVMGFCSSRRRAVCRDCTCPQRLASADLGSRAAPGKTSKVNSRAINLPLASEGGHKVLHPALLAALPGRRPATAKWGASSPPNLPPAQLGLQERKGPHSPGARTSLSRWRYEAKAHTLHLLLPYYTSAESL